MSGAVFTSRRRIHTHKHTPRAQTGTTNTAPDRRKSSPHPSSPSAQIPIYHRSLPGSSPPPLPDSLSSNSGALGFHSDEHGKLFTVYCPLLPAFPPLLLLAHLLSGVLASFSLRSLLSFLPSVLFTSLLLASSILLLLLLLSPTQMPLFSPSQRDPGHAAPEANAPRRFFFLLLSFVLSFMTLGCCHLRHCIHTVVCFHFTWEEFKIAR